MRYLWLAMVVMVASWTGVAGERRIEIRDYTGRGFAPDLVMYTVAGDPGRYRLFDVAGQPLPIQVVGADTIAFVASVPKGETATYILRDDGQGEVPTGSLKATRTVDGDRATWELTTAQLGVRVPINYRMDHWQGTVLSELPPPIAAFRSGDGEWRGAGRYLDSRTIKHWGSKVTANGPVFAEIESKVMFEDSGSYTVRIRVVDGLPLVQVSEEYDAGPAGATLENPYWELDLAAGWQPTHVDWARTFGNGGLSGDQRQPLAQAMGDGAIRYLVPDSAWGTPWNHLGLLAGETAEAGQMAGFVPLHKGDWRRMNAVEAHWREGGVSLRFPLRTQNASWTREVTSETSPFSMQEHEPGLSRTYGRRHWGLMLAPMSQEIVSERGKVGEFYQARLSYGVIGLDAYKDFVLDWPDAGATYPRLVPGRTVAAAAPAPKELAAAMKRISWAAGVFFGTPTMGHHYIAQNYLIADMADEMLSYPELPAETRAEIRSYLALACYGYEHPDAMSYANGSHPGNPNMGTARFASAPTFMALLPDHPMAPTWQEHAARYFEYKLSTQMAPGGGYIEYGAAYHMHGGARLLNGLLGLDAMESPNRERVYQYLKQDWQYYLDLLTPEDNRYYSRIIPGMANSPPGQTENFADAAGVFAAHDREFAGQMLWAWEHNGRREGGANLSPLQSIQPPLEAREPALSSAVYPGVGAIMRSHPGADESYVLFRSGFNWSHWYIDQGHLLFGTRGGWLLPYQPYQYWSPQDKGYMLYNGIRFGHQENENLHGWPDSNILDYAFGPTVDYAWSSSGFPDWYIDPGVTEEFRPKTDAPVATGGKRQLAEGEQTQGAFDWDRQVVFMKGETATSPHYLVVRDSISGEGKLQSWMYLNVLGDKSNLTVADSYIGIGTEWPLKGDLLFLQDEVATPEFHEEKQPIAVYNMNLQDHAPKDAKPSPMWVNPDGTQGAYPYRHGHKALEKHVVMRLPSAPGQGYFWLLYPRGEGEPAPQPEVLGDGVLKVTHPEGEDYVFVGGDRMELAGDDLLFEGRAGVVRVRQDHVILALTAGSGRIGYRGHIIAGSAPFEVRVPLADLTPGETRREPAHNSVAWQQPERPAGHQGPLVLREETAAGLRWTVAHDTPVRFEKEGVAIRATRAQVTIDGDTVRIVVPDAEYARITAGTVGVRGVGPFDLTFTRERITGRVDGRRRSLAITWPEGITKPMYRMDGLRYFAGWADDHSYGKGLPTPQFGIAFGVTDGSHDIEISEWTYPIPPTKPPRRELR